MENNHYDCLITTKGYDEFKPKTHNKQVALTKAVIEADHQDHPRLGYRHMPCTGT